jgi:HEAT repeat protein
MTNRIFKSYGERGIEGKQEVLSRCSGLLDELNVGLQSQMGKHLIDPLLFALSREEEPQVLTHLGTLLHRIAAVLIQFVEYPSATRILFHLQQRYHELHRSNGSHTERLGQALLRPLNPEAQQIVLEDFRSNEPSRQQKAAQLLAGLGPATIPMLIEVVKSGGDLRIRRLATSLLAEQGMEGTKQLKKDLILQTTSEERLRILEVIDGATHDLKAELVYAIHDESQQVRGEAIRLAERINDEGAIQLLLECTESKRGDVAVKAIKCLGRIRPQMALDRILSLLKSSKEKDRVVACCQTLAQIGDPKSIDILARILHAPAFLFVGKKYGPEARASAALALTQMNDPRVIEILGKYTVDKNAQVSDIARSLSFRRPQDPRPSSRETSVPKPRE